MNLLLDTHILLWVLAAPEKLPPAGLQAIHRDPIDRVLIAQSHNRQCHLLTVDGRIAEYRMPWVWVV